MQSTPSDSIGQELPKMVPSRPMIPGTALGRDGWPPAGIGTQVVTQSSRPRHDPLLGQRAAAHGPSGGRF